jgi:hypothetical protein
VGHELKLYKYVYLYQLSFRNTWNTSVEIIIRKGSKPRRSECVWKSIANSEMNNIESTLRTELSVPILKCLLSLVIWGRNLSFKIAASENQVSSCLPTFQSELRSTICKWLSTCFTCKTSSKKNHASSKNRLFQNNVNE